MKQRPTTDGDGNRLPAYFVDKHGCWIWTRAVNSAGYGMANFDGKILRVHRIHYEAFNGPVPKGLELDHLCRRRICVNPAHLEAVTHATNMARGKQAMKTHCSRGHLLAGENLRLRKAGNGTRECLRCSRFMSLGKYYLRKLELQ